MLSTLLSQAHGLWDRALPVFIALQEAPHAGGGAAAPSGGAAPASGGGPGGLLGSLAFPLLVAVFLYFVMIRPMGKQRKEAENLQKALQKGDKVVTTSGIVGTVSGVDEQFITLEISERVRVKFLRESVSRKLDTTSAAAKAGDKTTGSSEMPAVAKK